MLHVAILLKPYIRLILDGAKTVECRLTLTPRLPYRRIAPGERIYFKASAGPFMATAVVDAVAFYEILTPAKVESLRTRYNKRVCGQDEYWSLKRTSRYATFIKLREVQPTDAGPHIPPSRGPAWFTLEEGATGGTVKRPRLTVANDRRLAPSISPPSATPHGQAKTLDRATRATAAPPTRPPTETFTLKLTRSAFTTRVLRVPPRIHRFDPACYGGTTAARKGTPLRLHMPDGRVIATDLVQRDNKFRWRGWHAYIAAAGLHVGDLVHFQRLDLLNYRVSFLPKPRPRTPDQSATMTSTTTAATTPQAPCLDDFAPPGQIERLVRSAREEDLGPRGDDATSRLFVPTQRTTRAVLRARQSGRLSGAALLPAIARAYDPAITITPLRHDGDALDPGAIIAEIAGPLRSVLAMERVALNFATHLSGIASLTAQYVAAVAGTRAGIYDTRKTIPGLRTLEKYAVVCGGGHNYRMGLYDAVLVKDNHLAHLPLAKWPAALGDAITRARRESPAPLFIEIEVDTIAQLQQVLPLAPDIVLLDNMTPAQLREGVALRDRLAPGAPGAARIELEASGGVRLETVRAIAATGVDRIAIGALTHSAPALDLGLDIDA